MGGSPTNWFPALISHLAVGLAGFFFGGQTGFDLSPTNPDHIVELASEVAVGKFQSLVSGGGGDGGEEPGPDCGKSFDHLHHSPETVYKFEIGNCTISFLCGLIFCLIFVLGWKLSRWTKISSGESRAPNSVPHSSQKALAHQQLAELRLRRLNGSPKSTSSSSL